MADHVVERARYSSIDHRGWGGGGVGGHDRSFHPTQQRSAKLADGVR